MSDAAKWAVVLPPDDSELDAGAWGPFADQDEAKRWLDKRIEAADSRSDALYKRAYVWRLDNPV